MVVGDDIRLGCVDWPYAWRRLRRPHVRCENKRDEE